MLSERTPPKITPPHLVHLVAGCWANGGGLSEVVAATVLAQAQLGHRVTLLFLDGEAEHPLVAHCREAGVTVRIFHRLPLLKKLFLSRDLVRHLDDILQDATHLYLYSCWTFPIWWAAFRARRLHISYSLAPHGCLDPVRRAYGKFRKSLVWHLFDRHLLQHATWLHATAPIEASWMKAALGKHCPPIRIIPNGVDGELFDSVPEQSRTQSVLYLGRLHPLKGLDLLLDAWQRLAPSPEWELIIAGPSDGATLPSLPNVRVLPPCYGQDKVKLIKQAAFLILPTRSENFGIIVAEALWSHTPVICTKGAPWECLGQYWVDISADAIANALSTLMYCTPAQRTADFQSLFDSAHTDYHWQTIARLLLP
jgi:glycosyltransferase involved in cell wall biosynthesis